MPDPTSVHLTINGLKAVVPKGTLVVEAAKTVGVEIPVFCYHPKLVPVGACRMCLVEVEKNPRLQTACTMPVAEGLVVHSDSQKAREGQQSVLELLLANHPLDCPVCDKGGECPLQDNTFKYGPTLSRMTEEKRALDKAYPLSERIVLDRERCIMCLRCTRFHQEIPGDDALAVLDRGNDSVIGTHPDAPYDSAFSGNTIELCPVGALTSRAYRFRARPWDLKRTPSTCSGCAVGCNVSLHARDGNVLRSVSRDHPQVDNGWLCDHGRFDTLPHSRGETSAERPLRPLVREGAQLAPATFEAALRQAAELIQRGPLAVLGSASLTNEAVFQLAGPLRAARTAVTVGFTPACVSSWPVRGRIANLATSQRILLAGIDPWRELPVLALWLHKAVRRGAALVVVDETNGLWRDSGVWLEAGRGALAPPLRELQSALGGPVANPKAQRAAQLLRGDGPATLLAGLELARDPAMRTLLNDLARRIGADGSTGLVGAPPLAANGRGVQALAGDLADATLLDADGGLRGEPATLLVVGDVAVPRVGPGTRVILATHGDLGDASTLPAVDVVLPMLHPYEQAGSYTNLEGRVQQLLQSGMPGRGPLADFALLGELIRALGGTAPVDLLAVRAALAMAHPEWAPALAAPVAARGRFPLGDAAVEAAR